MPERNIQHLTVSTFQSSWIEGKEARSPQVPIAISPSRIRSRNTPYFCTQSTSLNEPSLAPQSWTISSYSSAISQILHGASFLGSFSFTTLRPLHLFEREINLSPSLSKALPQLNTSICFESRCSALLYHR
ncbi:hypothetical protein N3K66_008620 [Trichothecium roseum]|uniref:Uncharacterized protein n=1 Tax=Trichothecium roseum TaxID=47278 RepID=A0ACC0UQQ3_9HYPO|nr:hypothetical protein N3K66_008620 [Trichothecium roseum]